jgi:hypothetical protein
LAKKQTVQNIIGDLLDEEVFLGSTQVVIDAVKDRADLDITVAYASEQLHDLDLKYQKVKHISW